jgi:hypothetical protein
MDPGAINSPPQSTEWSDQYSFWHKILTSEVERLRFNSGLEPIDLDLYPVPKKHKTDPDYLGVTRVGPQKFVALAFNGLDALGKQTLHVKLRAQ